jgi:hypothetical protein
MRFPLPRAGEGRGEACIKMLNDPDNVMNIGLIQSGKSIRLGDKISSQVE